MIYSPAGIPRKTAFRLCPRKSCERAKCYIKLIKYREAAFRVCPKNRAMTPYLYLYSRNSCRRTCLLLLIYETRQHSGVAWRGVEHDGSTLSASAKVCSTILASSSAVRYSATIILSTCVHTHVYIARCKNLRLTGLQCHQGILGQYI